MTIPYKELGGSPTEHYGPDGIRAQRRVLCAWDDRAALRDEILGDGYSFGPIGPAPYPTNSDVIAAVVDIEPYMPSAPVVQGAFTDIATELQTYSVNDDVEALITINYELIQTSMANWPSSIEDEAGNDWEPDTFLTYRRSTKAEYMTIPGRASMMWEDQDVGAPYHVAEPVSTPSEAIPTIRIPIVDHALTWHRVTNPPWGAMRSCAGTINFGFFFGALPGTLLFDGAEVESVYYLFAGTGAVTPGYRVSYHFLEKQLTDQNGLIYGWNYTWRDETGPDAEVGWFRMCRAAKSAYDGTLTAELVDGEKLFLYMFAQTEPSTTGTVHPQTGFLLPNFHDLFRFGAPLAPTS